jgi:hypothetical protein
VAHFKELLFAPASNKLSRDGIKTASLKVKNVDPGGQSIQAIEWTMFVDDPELNRDWPISYLLARGEMPAHQAIELGQVGVFTHSLQNPVDRQHRQVVFCITRVDFTNDMSWVTGRLRMGENCFKDDASKK